MHKYLYLFAFLFIYVSISAQTTISYLPSTDNFANPERGFYRYSETRSSNYTLLDQATLEGYRQLHTPASASYSIYSTLVFRYFFLEDFKTANISQTYLDNIQTDFNTARLAGVKIIPRFAYTDEVNPDGCSSWICPPYGDAAKSWVLTHLGQLAPILETNKDVIASVQMGLVGVWGENYYTDFFGDASQGPDFKLLDANWSDRIEVVDALLDAVPVERMVQVRYPQQKQRAIYGINALTDSPALTLAEAFLGTDKARLGFHNDCILASADDFGTFTDYGNSSSSSMSDTTNLKPYMADDSQFVVVGGETCSDGYSPQNDCASSDPLAYGDTELERMHYSYLNAQYNNDVNNDWETGGCMDEIKQRLGYRFELQDGTFSDAAQPDQIINIDINLKNLGYASPYNERDVEIMLRNTATSEVWLADLTDDPRFWFANNSIYNINETLCIPSDMPTGTYTVLLNLPDPMTALSQLPEYSIRLANKLPDNSDPWEPTTGYNQLGHTITIDNTSANTNCNGEITFVELSTTLPIELVELKARSAKNDIVVEWTTAAEENNEGFFVERSLDGKSFTKVDWIKGKGTTHTFSHYQATDNKVDQDITYYYRLAQKDFDGTINLSKTVSARISSVDYHNEQFENSIKVFPNPANNQILVNWNSDLEEVLSISLINGIGQELIQSDIAEPTIDLTSLSSGIYFVKLSSKYQTFIKKVTVVKE